jgi:hypothetical protein
VRVPPGGRSGDIVAAYSDHLGELAAVQVISVNPERQIAATLELDWSGPEPVTTADLGPVRPQLGSGNGIWHPAG